MGLRELRRRANQTIKREKDERTRSAGVTLVARTLGWTLLLALLATFVILILPLPDRSRLLGFGLLPFVAFYAFMIIFGRGAKRERLYRPEFERSLLLRAIPWIPAAGLAVGVLSLVLGYSLGSAVTSALGVTLGLLVGGTLWFWQQGRKS